MTLFTSYHALIGEVAIKHSLDPNSVEAVVIQESGGKAHAYRFEPLFWARYLSKLPQYKDCVPERVSASYGLMQPMYTTCVENGFKGEPESLFIPSINLEEGCKQLKKLLDWAKGDYNSAFAAYNGGRADNEPGHKPLLRNQVYASVVKRILASFPKV